MVHAVSIATLMVVVVVACLLRDVEMFDAETKPAASLPVGTRDPYWPGRVGDSRSIRPINHNSYGVYERERFVR